MCSGFFTIEQLKHVSLKSWIMHGSDTNQPIIIDGGLIEGGIQLGQETFEKSKLNNGRARKLVER